MEGVKKVVKSKKNTVVRKEKIIVVKAEPVVAEPVVAEPVVAEPVVDKKSVHDDLNEQISSVSGMIKNLKAVEKKLKESAKTVKKDSKVKKRVMSEEEKEKRRATSGFNKPVEVSDALVKFLGLTGGSKVSRVEVTRKIISHVKDNNLQKGRNFDVDEKLKELLGEPIHLLNSKQPELGYGYSYFSLPKYLSSHYNKK